MCESERERELDRKRVRERDTKQTSVLRLMLCQVCVYLYVCLHEDARFANVHVGHCMHTDNIVCI